MTKNIKLILAISSIFILGVGIMGCDFDDNEIATATGVATTSPINNIIENETKIDETTTTTPKIDDKNPIEIKENNTQKDNKIETPETNNITSFDEDTTTQGATTSPTESTKTPIIATNTTTANEQELANLEGLGIAPLPNDKPVFYDKKVEDEIAQLINNFRQKNGLNSLNNNEELRQTARYKSNTLVQFGFSSEESKLKTNYLVKNVFKVPVLWCQEANGGGIGPEMATAEELYNLFITYPGAPEMVLTETASQLGVGVAIVKEELPLNVEGIDKTSYIRYTMYATYYVAGM